MNWTFLYSLRRPKIIAILLSLILIAAIPLTVFVAEQKQQTQQKAAGDFTCRVTAIPVDGVPSVRGEVTATGSKPASYNAVRWFIDGNPVRITSEARTTIGGLSKGPHTLGAKYIARSTNNPDGESLGAKTSLLAQADITDTPVPTASPTETTTPTPTEELTPTPTAEESPTPTASPTTSQSYAQGGLRGRYFNDPNPVGTPTRMRVDTNINFQWNTDKPPQKINENAFSVRWIGAIQVASSQSRYFYVKTEGKVRLTINGVVKIDQWREHTPPQEIKVGPLELQPGYNPIILDYSRGSAVNHMTVLKWATSDAAYSEAVVVPNARLNYRVGENNPSITPTGTVPPRQLPVDCGTSSFTITDGASPTPTGSTTPRPTGSITPTPTGNYLPGLRGRYFDNLNVEGTPKKIRTDDNINFNWSQDDEINNPPGGISEDSFSVRWVGYIKVDKASERYFWVRADDKIKLTINQNVVLNSWATQDSPVTNRASSRVSLKDGYNRIILDYSEQKTAGVNAATKLRWSPPDPTTNDPKYEDATPIQASRLFHLQSNASPTPTGSTTPGPTGSITPTPTDSNGLKASYFNNQDLKNAAKVVRIDDNIHFDWDKLPDNDKLFTDLGVTKDKFSVRWEGIIKPKATANYFFHTKTDDGVRLKIANQTVINDWVEHTKLKDNNTAASKKLVAGQEYKIVMEYFEVRTPNETINHVARLRWSKGTTSGTFADAVAIPNNILFPPKGTGTEKAKLSLKIKLDQIETSTDNSKPLRKERKIDLCIYRLKDEPKNDKNCANAYVHEKASVTFNPTSKLFENNNFEISKPITAGKYMVLAKTDGYLRGKAPAVQSIIGGEVSPIATITLYGGDIIQWDSGKNNLDPNNIVDIQDFNAIVACGAQKIDPQLITDINSVYNKTQCKNMFDEKNNFRSSADINDDGQIDIDDQVILLDSLERRIGE